MADVKWIKITTDVFDDEKILLIESLPEADSIIVIWFKLLCLAGKQNNSGVFVIGNSIPYTDKMLATIFRRKESTVQLALQTFEQFGMIELINGVITIPNWEKHQSIDKLEQIKEQTRKRVAKHREKQKSLSCNVTDNVTRNADVTQCNALDKIRLEKTRLDIESEREEQPSPTPTLPQLSYGQYNNVSLTSEQYEQLKAEYPKQYKEYIDRVSAYMEKTGKTYNSHYATIRDWIQEDAKKKPKKGFNNFRQREYDQEAMEQMLLANANPPKTAGEDENIRARADALKAQLSGKG